MITKEEPLQPNHIYKHDDPDSSHGDVIPWRGWVGMIIRCPWCRTLEMLTPCGEPGARGMARFGSAADFCSHCERPFPF